MNLGDLKAAIRCLKDGQVIIHPTESSYGFGGFLADRPLDVLEGLKGRSGTGFVVLIPSAESVADMLDDAGRALADAFWPGPLTLVLDDPDGRFHPRARAADGTVALRVPGHEVTRRLLRECGGPITSSSANPPGASPALTAGEARKAARARGHDLFALDAGPLPGGAASTLVRPGPEGPILIREGPIDLLQLDAAHRSGPAGSPSPGVFHITFVCTGNTCRSPMAEAIARGIIREEGIRGVTAGSAGTAAWEGAPATDGARAAAAQAGLDLKSHRSTLLTEEVVKSSGLILCMGSGHLLRAVELGGGSHAHLLSEMAGQSGDIADPFGGPDEVYRSTFNELAGLVAAVLTGPGSTGGPERREGS